ncbi:MAG: hypothetical protein PHP22_06875 [Oscillospiraceae bacterium]|nr:hypothetical protein [Oscillospiraceae bacterium]
MGKMKIFVCVVLIVTSLFTGSCSPSLQETSPATQIGSEISNTSSSDSAEQNSYSVSADDFHLEKSDNGVRSILTGELTPGVTINAQLYCDSDLDDPGKGRLDLAVFKVFSPSDIDSFLSLNWKVTSDQISEAFFNGSTAFSQRIAEYTDESDVKICIYNSYSNFFYTYDLVNDRLLQMLQQYRRIPWFSNDFAWGIDDFSFASKEKAFEELKQYAGRLGITVSPLFEVEYVTPAVFEAMYRLQIAMGAEDLTEKTWDDKDSAYWIEAAQDWYGLPIFSGEFGHVFDGTHLSGDEYKFTGMSQISLVQSERGVQNFRVLFAFQLYEEGVEEELVTLWDALQALKIYIENPRNEMEVLYGLPEQDVLIDRIELCYLPINQALDSENKQSGAPSEESMDMDGGNFSYVFQMTPCWIFRVVWKESGYSFSKYCAVNSITGEYLLQTMYAPDI